VFTEEKGQLILLHGFIKKAQKTHASDLALVRRRLTNVKKGRNS
jgi:phage-related protein